MLKLHQVEKIAIDDLCERVDYKRDLWRIEEFHVNILAISHSTVFLESDDSKRWTTSNVT